MRLLLAVCALAVIPGFAFSAQFSEYPSCDPETVQNYGLLGPVKSVRMEESGADGQRELTTRYVFDCFRSSWPSAGGQGKNDSR